MIFRLRRSDIIAVAIVILKPCDFSDILFASKTRVAEFRLWRKFTRREPNTTAIGNITRCKANKTAQLPNEKLGKAVAFLCSVGFGHFFVHLDQYKRHDGVADARQGCICKQRQDLEACSIEVVQFD